MKKDSIAIFEDRSDILIYLLLFAANLDGNISSKELKQILRVDDYESFERVYDAFKEDNDYAVLQNIKKFKQILISDGDTTESTISSIKQLFLSDGKFSSNEDYLIGKITKILSE
jgi:hypothetical protein